MTTRVGFDAPPPASWKITLLRDGRPARSTIVEHVFPSDLGELFPDEAVAGEKRNFLVEPLNAPHPPSSSGFAPNLLPPAERKMVEFLLLLPTAALLVCLFRNVVGLNSFGTFAPALLGLAFREIQSVVGVAVVLSILLTGWMLRRGLNRFHLLQVPRTALLLSLVVLMLLLFIVAGSAQGWTGAKSITLFPLVILTGTIERFWSMEEEDGTAASFRTLLSTLFIAGCVWLMASIPTVSKGMMKYPETLGLVMAGQLLLGRYTGFRLLELYRFRSMA